jgi:hypothetical protein
MEDVISQGSGRPPASPRRKLVIAAVVVAVAALVVVEHLPHGAGTRPHHAAARGPQYGGGEAILKLRAKAPVGPTGIIGENVPPGTRLPRTGSRPSWYSPGKASAKPIGGLPYNRPGYLFTRVAGGWAIQPYLNTQAACGDCPGSPVPMYYLGDRSRTATRVGSGTMVAPGAVTGTIWLTAFPPDRGLGTAPGLASEYSGDGHVVGAAIDLPPGYAIARGTSRGLLIVPIAELTGTTGYELWNPEERRVIRSFDGVIGASANQVAVTPPCAATCPVHVISLVTGRTEVLSVPAGNTATLGYFSSDGKFLALQVATGDVGDDGALATELAVADLATGRVVAVPQTFVNSNALDGFGWPDDGDNLAAELTFATGVQVAFWSPRTASMSVATINPDMHPATLVVG